MAPSAITINQEGLSVMPSKVVQIAGMVVSVYGLDEIPPNATITSVLWLLHGSTQSQKTMGSVAIRCIQNWYQNRTDDQASGLIAVAFDQRNHGTRLVERERNKSWNDGNETHAQDMFSIINGTVVDTSLLIDHLPSFVLNEPKAPSISQHLVLGFSLGGHAVWQAILHDQRITAGVSITGCPDYMGLMKDRARQWSLPDYKSSDGASFFDSPSFPPALIDAVKKWDIKAQLFGTADINLPSSVQEQKGLSSILGERLKDKKILACYGADDELVPHSSSQPMLKFLKDTAKSLNPYPLGDFALEDFVFPGTGHLFTEDMLQKAMRFINEHVAEGCSKK